MTTTHNFPPQGSQLRCSCSFNLNTEDNILYGGLSKQDDLITTPSTTTTSTTRDDNL